MGRVATLFLVGALSCGRERGSSRDREDTRLEIDIATQLSQRVRVPIRVRCAWLPPTCRASLPDGTALAIVIEAGGTWRLDGALVLADDLEVYLRGVTADLGAPQAAQCGARIRSVVIGERIECALGRGGKAFVTVNGDRTTAVEVELDPAAGLARSEVVRDDDLSRMSHNLEHADEEEQE